MSITYLDFERINTDENRDIKCEASINLKTSIPINSYNKISISKIDLDVGNNYYFMRVPLKQPQTYKDNTSYIGNYDMKDSNNNYIFNHDKGYFETIFKFVIYYDKNGSFTAEEFPVLYKSDEVDFNYSLINKREITTGNFEYDNFNEYFISYNANNFLSSLNECLKYVISNRLGITDKQIINLMPLFHTDDKKLIINNFSYGPENDMQEDNNVILQVQYPEEVNNGVYPAHTTPGPMFCIGLNKVGNNLLYHGLVSKKYNKGYTLNSSTALTEEYYFLKLDQILDIAYSIPSVSNSTDKYNISSQYVNEFYDMGDIKLIVIRGNLPVPPLYSIRKNRDFILTNAKTTLYSDQEPDVLFKLSINNNTLVPTRFIYQQPNIQGNFSSCIGGINGNYYYISVEYVDKYNNSIESLLSYGDKVFVQLCCFN